MDHSISFGDKNTWTDWKLIPSSRPVINPPTPKINLVDIPGKNGRLDISTLLTGRPLFGPRTGDLEFVVSHDKHPDWENTWENLYESIVQHLHGRKLKAILSDDPAFYYEGRFTLNSWSSEAKFTRLSISYVLNPYKMLIAGTLDEWMWDSFSFENGVIVEAMLNMNVSGSLTITLEGSPKPSIPTFTTSSAMTVLFDGNSYPLPIGVSRVPSIVIQNTNKTLEFSGNGQVTVDYRGGSL